MLKGLRFSRRLYAVVGALIVLASMLASGIVLYGGSSTSTGTTPRIQQGLLGSLAYHGPYSVEVQIVTSDVIARVKLVSIAQVVEELSDVPPDGGTLYAKALEFKFKALEYLKGSGGSEFVAVAYDLEASHETKEGADASGEDFLSGRDTQWDKREAIVFLWNAHPYLPSTKKADRYGLGVLRLLGEDNYTIASRHSRRWLPAASASASARAADGASALASISDSSEQRFFLEAPPASSGTSLLSSLAQALSGSDTSKTQTITLAELKSRIAAIDQEIKAGDGSEEYRECVVHKYVAESRVLYSKEHLAGIDEPWVKDGYYHRRYDHTLASGLPAGTPVYLFEDRHFYLEAHGETIPSKYESMFRLGGRDKGLFDVEYPGKVSLERPLPKGGYEFYFNHTPKRFIVCDGLPEEERKRREHFVTVTASAGTVHEAFFDPVAIGAGVGADAPNGDLSPASFTIGGAASTLQSLKWQNGSVTLGLSPYASLLGKTLDFIALDGTVALSLAASSATTNSAAGTLTWTVAKQPWVAGDQLMLRIWGAVPTPTPEPTATPSPTPTPEAWLSPDPSTAQFRAKGNEWHQFKMHSNEQVYVVVNPPGSPILLMLAGYNPRRNFCPGSQSDAISRRPGQWVYLAGCAAGTGTVTVEKGDGTVLQTYTITIAGE